MSSVLSVFAVIIAGLAQATVAPLFPIDAAVAELPLLTLALIAFTAGPRQAMVCAPIAALCTGFATDRAPGLLLLGYLPLLPLALVLEEAELPLPRYPRVLVAVVACGAWMRGILAASAMAQGAPVVVSPLVGDIIVPGMLFDAVLVSIAYLPLKLVGWSPRSVSLRRAGWL